MPKLIFDIKEDVYFYTSREKLFGAELLKQNPYTNIYHIHIYVINVYLNILGSCCL